MFLALTLAGAGAVVPQGCSKAPNASSTQADTGVEATADDAANEAAENVPDAEVGLDALEAAPPLVNSCRGKGAVSGVWLADPHLCLELYASGLFAARQLAFGPNGDLFVMAANSLVALFDLNLNGVIDTGEMGTFAAPTAGLTHGVAFSPDHAYLYASNATTIFRWPYRVGDHVASVPEEVVVQNMPAGGHFTRTLVFDTQGRLYVNVGAASNVDQDPGWLATRSMIRRFTIPPTVPAGGMDYGTGEVYASGLRNEVGLTFDAQGRMWGVENGRDSLSDPVLGNIANDNPAEEINRLDGTGVRFYGYPTCWTEFSIPDGGLGAGTQWADKTLAPALQQSDSWCRDANNVRPPVFAMPGHWAPLGVTAYTGNSLPWRGDLFLASHGSAYRTPPNGRLVAWAHLVGDSVASVTPLVGQGADGGLGQGTWDARPVDVREGPDGALYFSDDLGGRVFRLGYKP